MSQENKEKVYNFFDSMNIEYEIVDHPALFSQADNEEFHPDIDAQILKNLFLRNKSKSRYYLYVLPLEKKADLASLSDALNESRFSFGSETVLEEKLNIKKGSVSLLNIINAEPTDVRFIIDKEVFKYKRIALHPNDNTASLLFSPSDIEKILNHYDAKYMIL